MLAEYYISQMARLRTRVNVPGTLVGRTWQEDFFFFLPGNNLAGRFFFLPAREYPGSKNLCLKSVNPISGMNALRKQGTYGTKLDLNLDFVLG